MELASWHYRTKTLVGSIEHMKLQLNKKKRLRKLEFLTKTMKDRRGLVMAWQFWRRIFMKRTLNLMKLRMHPSPFSKHRLPLLNCDIELSNTEKTRVPHSFDNPFIYGLVIIIPINSHVALLPSTKIKLSKKFFTNGKNYKLLHLRQTSIKSIFSNPVILQNVL